MALGLGQQREFRAHKSKEKGRGDRYFFVSFEQKLEYTQRPLSSHFLRGNSLECYDNNKERERERERERAILLAPSVQNCISH